MTSIVFRFPLGRYHATPWGNHVNEGLVEWPPSPWRILRALVSTGFTKLGWSEIPDDATKLIERLASAPPPRYRVPRATAAHTRHWMPTDSLKPDARARVLDAFARVRNDAALRVTWDASLSPAEEETLRTIVPRIGYLGRADSIVVASVGEPFIADDDAFDVEPREDNARGLEPVSLLTTMAAEEYDSWRSRARDAEPSKARGKRGKEDPYPTDLVSAITVGTDFLARHKWSQPPGSKRVLYQRPVEALSTSAPPVRVRRARLTEADTAVFALSSPGSIRDVLPGLDRTVPLMEKIHRALASLAGERACPELTGLSAEGQRLIGHKHALLLPLSLGRREGRIDHVLVHAKMQFGEVAREALERLRWLDLGRESFRLTLVALGARDAIGPRLGAGVPELAHGRIWQSRTPFVPPRHLKKTNHTLIDQVQAELASRGLPRAREVRVLGREEVVGRGFHRFVRRRMRGAPQPPVPRFFGLELTFDGTVEGPIALGYGAHFGLGALVPMETAQ